VGQGQFGQVYCAIHRKTGRLVALKNLHRDRLTTHRFLREVRFLLSLEHPHIANCHALEQSSMGRQLVLDYCEGGTLRDLMEQDIPLSLTEILTLIAEVLSALEQAHTQDIVHCDIKPENILLSLTPTGWQAKVSDFGIARLGRELTEDAMGSPAYMAPERFYHQYGVASDLYAVGIVLYELLTGDRPFSGNYTQLMVAHLNQAVRIPDTLPLGVQELLQKALEKLMARRYRSAAAMQAAVLAIQQSLPPTELQAPCPKPLGDPPLSKFSGPPALVLETPCQTLALSLGEQQFPLLLIGAGQTLSGWPVADEDALVNHPPCYTWQFDQPVAQIMNTAAGVLVLQDKALYQLTAKPSPQLLATLPEPVHLAAGAGRWLIAHGQMSPDQGWLLDTRGQVPTQPQTITLPFPAQTECLLLLQDRYLLIAQNAATQTHLHVFSRWGKAIGRLPLQTSLQQLVPSQEPYRILAQAGSQGTDLLIIYLKPYRVMRCRLQMPADWIGELIIGIAAISRSGILQLVNFQGQLIGRVVGLPPPSAIAFHPPYHIWLATRTDQQTHVYELDIRTLGLEIVF
jgi:serine/threonine-protein kinase